ncbi:MAG: nucleotidyltransferase [Candidatus Hydrogenedentota bacterium]
MVSLDNIFKKIIIFLEKNKIGYLIIGGIAASILGYPRFTKDVDIILFVKKQQIKNLLKKFKNEGFSFDENIVINRVKETGTFQILYQDLHIDFIIVSSKFEKVAFSRRQRINIYGIKANFPTPEDLILMKIIPARHMDIADIENIAKRYINKLDKKYLLEWAQKLSDESEDMRIYNYIKNLL